MLKGGSLILWVDWFRSIKFDEGWRKWDKYEKEIICLAWGHSEWWEAQGDIAAIPQMITSILICLCIYVYELLLDEIQTNIINNEFIVRVEGSSSTIDKWWDCFIIFGEDVK